MRIRTKDSCAERGIALLPLIVVVALILVGGGSVTVYQVQKHNKTANEQLRREIEALKQEQTEPTSIPSPEPSPTPSIEPTLPPTPQSAVRGATKVQSVTATPTPSPTVAATPAAKPTPTKPPTTVILTPPVQTTQPPSNSEALSKYLLEKYQREEAAQQAALRVQAEARAKCLAEYNSQLGQLQAEYEASVNSINNNPWLSESLRQRQLNALQDKYDLQKAQLVSRISLSCG